MFIELFNKKDISLPFSIIITIGIVSRKGSRFLISDVFKNINP